MPADLPPPPPEEPIGVPPGLSPGQPQGPHVPATTGSRNAGVLCVIGGILVVVGGFLPVFRVVAPGGIVVSTVKGTEAGIGIVFLGGFAIFKGASALASGSIARLSSPLITAAFLTLLLVFRWNDINDAQEQVRGLDASLTGQIGIGFWLDVIGTILIAVAGLLLLGQRRSG